jgi:hypothetical protein
MLKSPMYYNNLLTYTLEEKHCINFLFKKKGKNENPFTRNTRQIKNPKTHIMKKHNNQDTTNTLIK